MRDMLDHRDAYPIAVWRPALTRIQQNLDDAIRREAELSEGRRASQRSAYLRASFDDFWRTAGVMFERAAASDAGARKLVRDTLQPRQEALAALVARLLVENSDRESQTGIEVQGIYAGIERNAYLLLGLSIALISVTSLGLIRANRRVFSCLSRLAHDRRDLAQQLITTQESTLRNISRDLHDEFGQILTAVGALLRRAKRHAPPSDFQEEVQEVSEVVQATLEKIRSLSQSLQPVILEEQGLLAAVRWHLQVFERHAGIAICATLPVEPVALPVEQAIHVYRILQEALNNVARHAGVTRANVSLESGSNFLRLMVEDTGRGIPAAFRAGVGLTAMRERAELVGGRLAVGPSASGGTRVSLNLDWLGTEPGGEPSREILVA